MAPNKLERPPLLIPATMGQKPGTQETSRATEAPPKRNSQRHWSGPVSFLKLWPIRRVCPLNSPTKSWLSLVLREMVPNSVTSPRRFAGVLLANRTRRPSHRSSLGLDSFPSCDGHSAEWRVRTHLHPAADFLPFYENLPTSCQLTEYLVLSIWHFRPLALDWASPVSH